MTTPKKSSKYHKDDLGGIMIDFLDSLDQPSPPTMHIFNIKVSDMVVCTIHQDKETGGIYQVCFTTDDGKGCPVTSVIGDVKDADDWVRRIRAATDESIDLINIWNQSNTV